MEIKIESQLKKKGQMERLIVKEKKHEMPENDCQKYELKFYAAK